ncbi:MAG: hypothetical protein PWR10_2055 [Halanaerobiales bacterium]|nr:hypothetical protein [Halanaerobiales bacterium]
MSITIAGYKFTGPYTSTTKLKDKQGIYAILCLSDDQYKLLDIGESARVRSRVESHERMKCWQRNCSGTFAVAVYYTPHWTQIGRAELQQKIRELYNPPCGKKIDGILNFISDKS